MKDPDLEKLWREIDADLEQDDSIEIDDYLQQKGVKKTSFSSVQEHAVNLIQSSFSAPELSDKALQNKYKIIKQIDSGGQSDIYLAERNDGVYQQTVVIKFISGRFEQSALKQQFLQEMQLLADLKHPGVVTIIDGNITEKGQPWLVLEYLEGLHIDEFVAQQQLEVNDVVSLVMDLCDTLQFVHQRQVFHKDLKPSNVLIKQINGVSYPVLIDFGIAMQQGEQSSLAFGTKGFSAPEQINNLIIDQRTDLYSLGILLGYLLLKGKGKAIVVNDAKSLINALTQSGVPSDLVKLVTKLTKRDREKRYQSAGAVRSDLSQWQQGFPLSFDNHKLSKVLLKSVKRHPLVSIALFLVLFIAVFFTAKYTRDTQHLQQLTIAEKNATDELMNFMLDDLYENLERIGRIDVLKTVAEKSVEHLAKQDPLTLDFAGHLQAAKAYTNTGRVFDYLEQSDQAQKMFAAAETHLNKVKNEQPNSLAYFEQMAQLKVHQSQVMSSVGQEHATETVLKEAISAMQNVLAIEPSYNPYLLWEANLELGYHLMEYAKAEQAKIQVNYTLQLSEQQLTLMSEDPKWLYANSQSLQMKAWFEFDFGQLAEGIEDLMSAIEFAKGSIRQDQSDLKKQNNLRILHNQLAYLYLENQQNNNAKITVLKAIELGNELKLKAPFNQEYEREQAYSYSTAGEVFQQLEDYDSALIYSQLSLALSEQNYAKDPTDFSTVNDLAVDSLLVAGLLKKANRVDEAKNMFGFVEDIMLPVHQSEPNNKFYAHTLLVSQLQLHKFDQAKKLYEQVLTNDMVDGVVEALLDENNLDWTE